MIIDEFVAYFFFGALLICWIIIMIIAVRAMLISFKLVFYLRDHSPDRYRWLVFWPDFSVIGSARPIRYLKYIYMDMDDDDPLIRKYKWQIRYSTKLILRLSLLMLTIIVAFIVWGIVWDLVTKG